MAKGIELSVNFLVMFILAIVTFGLGLTFLYNIYGQTQEFSNITKEQIDGQIHDLLCTSADKICISGNHQQIRRNEYGVFGMHAYNYFVPPEHVHYTAMVSFENVYDKDNAPITLLDEQRPRVIGGGESTIGLIAAGKQGKTGIGISVPKTTPSGNYVFNVDITALDQNNLPKATFRQKIYFKVP